MIYDTCRDPLASAPHEIEEASIISDRFLRAIHRYSDSRLKISYLTNEIEGVWSATGPDSERDLDDHDGILFRADELDKNLADDSSLSVLDIEGLAAECMIMLEDLRDIFARYSSTEDLAADDEYIDERASALEFFSFAPGTVPSEAEIKKVFREMWKRYNVDDPSHRITEEQRLENEYWLKEINKHYAVLRPKKADITD
jgi:hypothetical protein